LKRSHAIAGILIILASTLLIEHYTNRRFPTQDYPLAGVPELEISETRTFSYTKAMDQVGTYSYTITDKEDGLYTMSSLTDVSFEGESILLESSFVFDETYRPQEYTLVVAQGGATNEIQVTFTEGNVVSTVTLENDTVTLSDEFPSTAFMTENNMPGLWELLLISADLDMGARYSAEVYIPQGGAMFDLEFYVQNDLQSITLGEEQHSCTVIQETTLDLRFYLCEGELVQMRNDDQDIIFTLIS